MCGFCVRLGMRRCAPGAFTLFASEQTPYPSRDNVLYVLPAGTVCDNIALSNSVKRGKLVIFVSKGAYCLDFVQIFLYNK